MSEISLQESQQPHAKNDATGKPTEISGLGALLRSERENRGLSHEQLAQITRLRKRFLEALENEEWENLPPSVFVKGFIRSYAKALGLDEGKLLDLYKSTVPDDVAPSIPILVPKKPKNKIPLVLASCLIALAIAVYFFIGRPSPEQGTLQSEEGLPAQIQEGPTKEKTQPVLQEKTDEELVQKQEETVEVAPPHVGIAEMDIPESKPQEKETTSYPTDEELPTPSETDLSGSSPFWLH
jgi:cytoskeletal protein RodZ